MFNAEDYYRENREKLLAQAKAYYRAHRAACIRRSKARWRRNKKRHSAAHGRWTAARPWDKHLRNAKARCEVPTTSKFEHYGGKGIKCLLTIDEVEVLWHRDHADSMTHPSLSRKDVAGNYDAENCRFVEFAESRTNRPYGRSNAVCRGCGAAFYRVNPLNTCQACRRLEQTKSMKYPRVVQLVRDAAAERGLIVESMFGRGVARGTLKINGRIVIVSRCDTISDCGGRKYSHFRRSRYAADVYCLVRQIEKRHEIFFYPNPASRDFFIPVIPSGNGLGRKPAVDWLKLKDAWQVFDSPAV